MRVVLILLSIVVLLAVLAGLYMFHMPGRSHEGALPALRPTEVDIRERLAQHVQILAGSIGERHLWRRGSLEAAAGYIRNTLQDLGYTVVPQTFEVRGSTVANLQAERTGAEAAAEIIVIGAHYDSVPGSPGANDNASGVAAVLELARLLASRPLPRTVRFVAFANEEQPFFHTDDMGSWVYARQARQRGDNIVAMLSIETIGYYDDTPGSQHYPAPFGWFYPDVGNFIGFVGNLSSRALVRRCIGTFRRHTTFPSQGTAAPAWLPGIGWSDHWAFWEEGYAAAMVTDTALFRYRAYHTAADAPAILDYERMARVVAGLTHVIGELATPRR